MTLRDQISRLFKWTKRDGRSGSYAAAYAVLKRYRKPLVYLDSTSFEMLLDEAGEIDVEKLRDALRLVCPKGNVERFVANFQKHGTGESDPIRGFVGGGSRALKLTVEGTPPPRVARFALLLIPKKNREHLIGDIEEEYRTVVLPEHGKACARFWYWEQTVLALGFSVWPFVKRILGLTAIWKLIGR